MQSAFRQQLLGICKINETKTIPPTLYKVNEADVTPAAAPATPDPAVDAAVKVTTDLFIKLQSYISKDAMPLMSSSQDPIFAALTNIVPQLNAIATQLKNNKVKGAETIKVLSAPIAATVDAEAKKKADEAAKKTVPPAPPVPPTQKPGTTGTQPAPGAAQPAVASTAPTKPGAPPAPAIPAAK